MATVADVLEQSKNALTMVTVRFRLSTTGGVPLQSATDALTGFSLDRGSVDNGILTCHRHHVRFDLESRCTFG